MSWLLFAVGSAFFAGITAILAKIGIQSVPSHLATALRTGVVLVFAWGMVFLVGSQGDLAQLTGGGPGLAGAVGPGHRGLLAVLLPGPPAGGCEQGHPH